MGDHIARGEDFENKAEKKLGGWGLFGSKYEDAADLFDKAGNCFKLAKSWDKAGAVYVKLANCHLKVSVNPSVVSRLSLLLFSFGLTHKIFSVLESRFPLRSQLDSKHEAANAYADAAHCYKKSNIKEAISCLEQSVNLFLDIGRLNLAARYYKEIAELYEQEQYLEQAISYYEKAADLFQSEDVTTTANQCKQRVAQFSAQMEKYPRAIEIFEEIARHSVNNNLLKYGVRGHLLNAGICQLCKGDVVAINNALERYQELDPTFSGTRECKLLVDLAAAIDEEDVAKFTDAVKEYDSMTQLWLCPCSAADQNSVMGKVFPMRCVECILLLVGLPAV
ncbi:Alpha-soluble NSF attachment protein [Capsicum annuum]|nr:Alpha-soluble NSF attachment protein [Capsicum annuum]KAF3681523.1 Alpha-soluble NSF attachment protein [Capsicum annuum]